VSLKSSSCPCEGLGLEVGRERHSTRRAETGKGRESCSSSRTDVGWQSALSACQPLVSIVLISYQDRAHVCEAVDSALGQSYPHCEVIVIDDGSSDGTGELIASRFGHRVAYRWQENHGQGSARSLGLACSAGEYIQFLDSDDILLPNKVKSHVACLEANRPLAFVYGRTLCFIDGRPEETWEHPSNSRHSGNLFERILNCGNSINIAQPLIRRTWIDRIGGFDPDIREADDNDLMVRIAYTGGECQFIDEPAFLYRHYPNDLGQSYNWHARHSGEGQMRGDIYVLSKLRSMMLRDARSGIRKVEERLGELSAELGWRRFRAWDQKAALPYLLQGIRFSHEHRLRNVCRLATATLPWPALRKLKHRLNGLLDLPGRRYGDDH